MKTLVLVLALCACGRSPAPEELTLQVNSESGSRFSVTAVGAFDDRLAYNGRRGIYVIRDTATGQEFVGVSGIGISELGSHKSGKRDVTDER